VLKHKLSLNVAVFMDYFESVTDESKESDISDRIFSYDADEVSLQS
jgi:hypothetical protein